MSEEERQAKQRATLIEEIGKLTGESWCALMRWAARDLCTDQPAVAIIICQEAERRATVKAEHSTDKNIPRLASAELARVLSDAGLRIVAARAELGELDFRELRVPR